MARVCTIFMRHFQSLLRVRPSKVVHAELERRLRSALGRHAWHVNSPAGHKSWHQWLCLCPRGCHQARVVRDKRHHIGHHVSKCFALLSQCDVLLRLRDLWYPQPFNYCNGSLANTSGVTMEFI